MIDYSTHPAHLWLSSGRCRNADWRVIDGRSVVTLSEFGRLVGIGRGADHADALQAAVNDLFGRQLQEEADAMDCDEANRRSA